MSPLCGCTCGHGPEHHLRDGPGSGACHAEGCPCGAYEEPPVGLPGWEVAPDRVTITLPVGITLREDTECVYVITGDRIYPLPASVSASILNLIVEAIADDMQVAAELAPNGLAFNTQEETER